MKRGPVPLPPVSPARRDGVVFGLCQLDRHGRVCEARLLAALGWDPGLKVGFTIVHGVVVVAADGDGCRAVCPRRWLWLPARVRQAVNIRVGERVLLAALTGPQRLLVHPLWQLDQWSTAVHARVLGGELR